MMKGIFLVGCFLLSSALLIDVSQSEAVAYRLCNSTGSEINATSTIHEVTITPCAEAPDGACKVAGGQNATITIDFTPSARMGPRTRHGFYWAKAVDVQLPGIPKTVCRGKFVNCKLPANTRRTYTAVIPLKSSFPKKIFPVKAKIYEGRKVHVCVLFNVEIV